MSFYTGVVFYRPIAPPVVSADQLSRFLQAIHEADFLAKHGVSFLGVKYGERIDADDKGTSWEEDLGSGVSEWKEIDWDFQLSGGGDVSAMVSALKGDKRSIYRADVILGTLRAEIYEPISRVNSPENSVDFTPYDLSLSIGPIEIYDLRSQQPFQVGWIGLKISGPGYLFPWSFRDLFHRIKASPEIQKLEEACRVHWPAQPGEPDPRLVKAGEQHLGELWPYDQYDLPNDWFWGLRES